MTETITVCPECDGTGIRSRNGRGRDDVEETYRCRCGHTFDTPARRSPEGRTDHDGGSAAVQAALDADPEEVL